MYDPILTSQARFGSPLFGSLVGPEPVPCDCCAEGLAVVVWAVPGEPEAVECASCLRDSTRGDDFDTRVLLD